jgi:hypothetical protein
MQRLGAAPIKTPKLLHDVHSKSAGPEQVPHVA